PRPAAGLAGGARRADPVRLRVRAVAAGGVPEQLRRHPGQRRAAERRPGAHPAAAAQAARPRRRAGHPGAALRGVLAGTRRPAVPRVVRRPAVHSGRGERGAPGRPAGGRGGHHRGPRAGVGGRPGRFPAAGRRLDRPGGHPGPRGVHSGRPADRLARPGSVAPGDAGRGGQPRAGARVVPGRADRRLPVARVRRPAPAARRPPPAGRIGVMTAPTGPAGPPRRTGAAPHASRPRMPGYGLPPADEGMWPWAWAEEILTGAQRYWLATTRPDGRPHLMPVWGVWRDCALWFSTGDRSVKAANLAACPACAVSVERGPHGVVIEGTAHRLPAPPAEVLAAYDAKYRMGIPPGE